MEPKVKEARERMEKTLSVFAEELARERSGRASVGLVENIRADYYGTQTPLKQLASIHVPDPKTIVVQPWDPQALQVVEVALGAANLGANPTSDGTLLRLVLPPLNEERRKEAVKLIKEKLDGANVAFRNIRRETLDGIKALVSVKQLTDDDRYLAEEQLNRLIDEFQKKAGELFTRKETEIMEV